MIIVSSHNGVPVRLTEERWRHITRHHPEMLNLKEQTLETLTQPELIQQGDYGEMLSIRLYPSTPLTRKHLVVVYREISQDDGFILTAYLATKPSPRRITLWKQ